MVRRSTLVGLVVALGFASGGVAVAKGAGKKTTISVEGTIGGAKVYVDGKEIGKTPLKNKDLSLGNHTIVVKKLGYLDFTEKVSAKAGKPVAIFADMLPFAGVIKVQANVPKAVVSVDGKAVGKVPLEHELKIGSHTVTVSAPGYGTYSKVVAADPGNEYEVQATLQKSAADAVDELALVPLAAPGGRKGSAAAADDLALAPLPGLAMPPKGGKGAEVDALGELPLEAPPPGGGDGDALLPLEAPPLEILAVSPTGSKLSGPTANLGATVTSAKPWYLQWWALTGAAALVVTGVSVAIWAGTRGDGTPANQRTARDGSCSPSSSSNGCSLAPYVYYEAY
ncbi:MAG: PEGA domain-containing protein [Deltaproteobacteria bacterium]|nr:PEGA domain-containing protein [Deltaproteobacteria bacterium]